MFFFFLFLCSVVAVGSGFGEMSSAQCECEELFYFRHVVFIFLTAQPSVLHENLNDMGPASSQIHRTRE